MDSTAKETASEYLYKNQLSLDVLTTLEQAQRLNASESFDQYQKLTMITEKVNEVAEEVIKTKKMLGIEERIDSDEESNADQEPSQDPLDHADQEQHLIYVNNNPDYRAASVANRGANDSSYMAVMGTVRFCIRTEPNRSVRFAILQNHLDFGSVRFDTMETENRNLTYLWFKRCNSEYPKSK